MEVMTPLLCEALALLENGHQLVDASPALLAWKKKHEGEDRRRIARESAEQQRTAAEQQAEQRRQQERAEVLASLTPTQRFKLGL